MDEKEVAKKLKETKRKLESILKDLKEIKDSKVLYLDSAFLEGLDDVKEAKHYLSEAQYRVETRLWVNK